MTKPPADDKAMRDARKVVEDHIRACGDERMGVLNPDILKESIAAHFRNYEIAVRMLEERIKAGEERAKQLQEDVAKACAELGQAQNSVMHASREHDRLLKAIHDFRNTRGRHDGEHSIVGDDGHLAGKPCARCDEAYIKAEAELDKAIGL